MKMTEVRCVHEFSNKVNRYYHLMASVVVHWPLLEGVAGFYCNPTAGQSLTLQTPSSVTKQGAIKVAEQ